MRRLQPRTAGLSPLAPLLSNKFSPYVKLKCDRFEEIGSAEVILESLRHDAHRHGAHIDLIGPFARRESCWRQMKGILASEVEPGASQTL